MFWHRPDLRWPLSWADWKQKALVWDGGYLPLCCCSSITYTMCWLGERQKKQEKSLKWQHGSLPVLWFRPQGHTSCHHCHCCELNNLTVARHPPLAGGSQCFTDTHNKEPHVHVHFYPLWFILNTSGAVRPNVCNQWALQKGASLKTHPQWCEVWLWCASSLGGPLHQPTMPNTHQFYFHIS